MSLLACSLRLLLQSIVLALLFGACRDDSTARPPAAVAAIDSLRASAGRPDHTNWSITGNYVLKRNPGEGGGQLRLLLLDSTTVQYELSIVNGAPGHEQGFAAGLATVTNAHQLYFKVNADCHLRAQLDAHGATLEHLLGDYADCGFDEGVVSAGYYHRTHSESPFGTAVEDSTAMRFPYGEWRAVDDAKVRLHVQADGRFEERYDGELVVDATYRVFGACPADCPTAAEVPCLRISSVEGVTCYAILVSDANQLALSLLGGRGNTLHYVRPDHNARH